MLVIFLFLIVSHDVCALFLLSVTLLLLMLLKSIMNSENNRACSFYRDILHVSYFPCVFARTHADTHTHCVTHFNKLIQLLSCSYRFILILSQKLHDNMLESVKRELKTVPYMACTSDIWTKDRRSFIAMNVHWIDQTTGELKSFLLCCERFRGSHTGAAIEDKIKSILQKFGIQNRVTCITTDNASNYTCAFDREGDNYQRYSEMMDKVDEDEEAFFQLNLDDMESAWCRQCDVLPNPDVDVVPMSRAAAACSTTEHSNSSNSDSDPDTHAPTHSKDNGMGSIRLRNIAEAHLENVLDPNIAIKMPSRIGCAAHSLNLIGKLDAMDDEEYSERYMSVFGILNSIWKVCGTRQGRETFAKYLNGTIIYKPHRIRWNRIFDAVKNTIYLKI